MRKIDTSVGDLVDMIARGELRLPEMQRRYVWTSALRGESRKERQEG